MVRANPTERSGSEDELRVVRTTEKSTFRYEWILMSGFLLTTLAMCNVFGYTHFTGDFFWALAGAALSGEAIVELYYERRKGNL